MHGSAFKVDIAAREFLALLEGTGRRMNHAGRSPTPLIEVRFLLLA